MLFSGKSQSTDIRAADSLYALGNYSAAINKYAKDGSKNAQQQIARAYHAIGNYEKAITQYEHLVRRDSLLQIARFELGKLYLKTKEAGGIK